MNISVNVSNAIRDLNSLQTRGLPTAISRALNRVALDAREAVLNSIPVNFRLRTGSAWLNRHFKVTPANAENLVAYFFTDLEYMDLQERTGIKTPKRGPHLAVPLGALRLKTIPANLKPRFLLGNDLQGVLKAASLKTKSARKRNLATAGKGFLLESGGKTFIAVRNGKQVTILYTLVPAVKIGVARLQMFETTRRVVTTNFPIKFASELNRLSLRS